MGNSKFFDFKNTRESYRSVLQIAQGHVPLEINEDEHSNLHSRSLISILINHNSSAL